MHKEFELKKAIETLVPFIGPGQLRTLRGFARGEEKEWIDKLCDLAILVDGMPKTYEQDGKGENALVSLHYFLGNMDWYITEKDMEPEQNQAFGLADLGYGAELGYISIIELLENGVELDLHFKPRTLGELHAARIFEGKVTA